ncbi:MAG TPA: hypothetical protein VII34_09205, partial [Pyrinomonadaceae bacterium]
DLSAQSFNVSRLDVLLHLTTLSTPLSIAKTPGHIVPVWPPTEPASFEQSPHGSPAEIDHLDTRSMVSGLL